MPFYDYPCQDYQAVFEVRATFKEKEEGIKPQCPQCQSKQTRQLLTTGLFLRKTDEGTDLILPACGPNAGPGCCGG